MENLKIDVRELSDEKYENVKEAIYKLTGNNYAFKWNYFQIDLQPKASSGFDSEVTFSVIRNKQVTYNELMEIAGMSDKKTFTKADLVAGKHVFETREGTLNLVIKSQNGLSAVNLDGRMYFGDLKSYKEDLTYSECESLDIVAVYEIYYPNSFNCLSHQLVSIWRRAEKTETQIQFEKLQQQIAELQAQANKLQQTL